MGCQTTGTRYTGQGEPEHSKHHMHSAAQQAGHSLCKSAATAVATDAAADHDTKSQRKKVGGENDWKDGGEPPKQTELALAKEQEEPAPMVVDVEEGEEVPRDRRQREKRETERKIMHVHRVTGHSSFQGIAKALEARGANQEVVNIAKNMQCPTCQERKRTQPRRHATLDTLPRKWERLQIDTADWDHPLHKTKHRFVMFVDEGSKYRAGMIFKGNARKAGSWEDLKLAYEQIWLSHHGNPAVVRVDPAGPWRSAEADRYYAERGVELQPIPAEAHCHQRSQSGHDRHRRGVPRHVCR